MLWLNATPARTSTNLRRIACAPDLMNKGFYFVVTESRRGEVRAAHLTAEALHKVADLTTFRGSLLAVHPNELDELDQRVADAGLN